MADIEGGEILLDQHQHGRDRRLAHQRQPALLGEVEQRGSVLLRQRLADRLQVVAGIEPRRDLADVLAQRLAVAQVGRARQRVDLGAGVVDVVLARHVVAGEREQIGERIAEHRAAAVADVHGTGRIGRHVLDVDPLALAEIGAAIGRALFQDRGNDALPEGRPEAHVEEARPRHLDPLDVGIALSFSASCSAMSRGFIFAALASTSAALQARSPCAASRGGATSTLAKSSPPAARRRPAAPAARRGCGRARARRRSSARTCRSELLRRAPELTQFRGSVKQAPVLVDGKAVGHAGDEIGHHGGAAALRRRRSAAARQASGISPGSAM